jgi:hypothetical protein
MKLTQHSDNSVTLEMTKQEFDAIHEAIDLLQFARSCVALVKDVDVYRMRSELRAMHDAPWECGTVKRWDE